MVLTDAQALERIRQPLYKEEIDRLRKLYEELRAQVTGKDIEKYLPAIPQYERDELRQERLKMMTDNTDLLSRILNPRSRIFNAKGGVEHFIITNQKKEETFRNYIDKISQGLSLKDWIKCVAIRKNDYDPNGIILIEVDGNKKIYPCFKSIMNIHDRELNGRTPEYLILKLTKKEVKALKSKGIINNQFKDEAEIFRCIDDTTDRIFSKDRLIKSITSFYAPNFPGIVSSNIWGDEEDTFFSPLERSRSLLKKYLLRSSINNVVVARQSFPKEWMQWFDCPTCQATGVMDGVTCPECHGQKCMLSQKHSDVLVVDYRGDDMKNVPHAPMGNVEAGTETLEFLNDTLEQLEDKIHYEIWGMYKSDKISSIRAGVTRDTVGSNIEPTAYQAMLNSQPMVNKLVDYGKWYSEIYQFSADVIGFYLLKKAYKGSAILCGDRFMIESPDATWDRYLKAVQSEAPMSELDSILIEYIENKYCNNPILYRKYMLLLGVEPFLHFKVKDVLAFNIPEIIKQEKIFFDEWKTSLTDWQFTQIADGIADIDEETEEDDSIEEDASEAVSDVKIDPIANLKKSLRTYVLAKIKEDDKVLPRVVTDPATGLPIPATNKEGVPDLPTN